GATSPTLQQTDTLIESYLIAGFSFVGYRVILNLRQDNLCPTSSKRRRRKGTTLTLRHKGNNQPPRYSELVKRSYKYK
ncbi:hypothetical protein AB1N83_001079, partial [Pleurotus pulmonarius]